MNREVRIWALIVSLLAFTAVSYSQVTQVATNKWSIGLNVGGQRLYGDRTSVGVGLGFEGFITNRVLKFAELSFALGYSQLKYKFATITSTTDLFNADLKGNFEVVSQGLLRPFLTLGVGVVNFHILNSGIGRFWDATLFGGGGFKFNFNSRFDWIVSADYRFTSGDNFDNIIKEGKSKDGYLNVRAGVAYKLPTWGSETPDVIASERAPFYEVGNETNLNEAQPNFSKQVAPVTMNMEEYVKLKSRIDALSQGIDTKENEIERLQGSLSERKKLLTSLENKAAKQPMKNLAKTSSMSGFSEIYEEALTNYYNKSYSEAISLFKVLLQQYPNHTLASNCQYWIGRSLFAMNRFQESIDAFYKVLSYERSLKKDESLFILGKAYLKIGSGERARESFSRLIREYPNSEFVEDAKTYIGKL